LIYTQKDIAHYFCENCRPEKEDPHVSRDRTKMIEEYYTANASLRDESAVRSVKAMLDEYKCLDEKKRNSWSTFDLCTGRWEYLNGKPLNKKNDLC